MGQIWDALGFGPADILLPQCADMERWSVVACDQYTSEPAYWERVERLVGDAPSSLRLILPEQKLEDGHTEAHIAAIDAAMEDYLSRGLFRSLPGSIIYVERWLSSGALRRGLVGQIDLGDYDYRPGSSSPIRATERTVLSRIPPRLAVRRDAPLELPHVMLLLDDPSCEAIGHYSAETAEMELLYDFDLMENGGHITGYRLTEQQMAELADALTDLTDPERLAARYHTPEAAPMRFAVGDGNHSLAAAKANYEEKKGTPAGDRARYALVELVDLHDESLVFQPIHRVCFGVEPEQLLRALLDACPGAYVGEGEGQTFVLVDGLKDVTITVPEPTEPLTVGTVQKALDAWLPTVGASLDYIHGEDVLRDLCARPGNVGLLLPPMDRSQLFPAVIQGGTLPRKTFSMGEAQDKRFYLEARMIR